MHYKKSRALLLLIVLTISLVPFQYLEFSNIQFASGATTSFSHTPYTTSGSPAGPSTGINFYGTLSGTIFGDIQVKDGTTLICTAVAPVGAWYCPANPDWTTPSSGTSNKIFSATAGGMTTAYTTVYWTDVHSPTFTTPSGTTEEYATSGSFYISWNSADVDGDLDEVYVDDLDGGYVYTTNADYYDLGISGTTDTLNTYWYYYAFLGTKTYTGRVFDSGNRYATTGTVSVTIQDTTDPVITATPTVAAVNHEDGDTTARYIYDAGGSWTATDALPDTYDLDRICYAWTGSRVEQTRTTVRNDVAWTSGVAVADYNHAVNPYDAGCNWDGYTGTQSEFTVWQYEIEFEDTSGNTKIPTPSVWGNSKVYKDENPDPNSPSNIAFEVGLTGQTIAWTWTDNAPSNVVTDASWNIYKNVVVGDACTGGAVDTGTWSGDSGGKTYDASGETVDNYYCIKVQDSAGNYATDTVYVDITSAQAPNINSPANLNFEIGTPGQTIAWTWTDNYDNPTDTGDWEIFSDTVDTVCTTGDSETTDTWSGTEGDTNIGGFTSDKYYCIEVIDQAGNSATDIVYVDVVTSVDPTFSYQPSTTTYENGNTVTHNIYWDFADNFDGDTWEVVWGTDSVCTEDNAVDSDTWSGTSGSTGNIDVGSLSSDRYYCISVIDVALNEITDNVLVDIKTDEAPQITFTPSDTNYESGNEITRNIHWTATDDFPDQYTIERKLGSGSYSEMRGLTAWSSTVDTDDYDVGNLTEGVWTFKITFYEEDNITGDANGLNATDEIVVTVVAGEAPQLTNIPDDINYEAGNTTTLNVQWTATDSYAYQYIIQRKLDSGSWATIRSWVAWTTGVATAVLDVGSLGAGVWTYQIMFNETTTDASGLTANDTMIVTVTAYDPVITVSPGDLEFAQGNGYSLIWNFTDGVEGYDWKVYRSLTNDSFGAYIDTGSWPSPQGSAEVDITIHSDDYYYMINVTDNADGWDADYITVKIYPNITVAEFYYTDEYVGEYYSTIENGYLQFTAFDKTEGTYTAYMNDTLIGQDSWTNNTINAHSLANGTLASGTYNLTLSVNDTSNVGIYTTMVYYTDAAPTLLLSPINQTVEYGTTVSLRWAATDSYPNIYELRRNETLVATDSWSSADYIDYSTDQLEADYIYLFEILIYDTVGNVTTDTVEITVVMDNTNPVFSNLPADSLVVPDIPHTLTWTITDSNNGTYILYRNGVNISDGNWLSGDLNIDINETSVPPFPEARNYTLVILDYYNNSNQDLVWICAISDDGNPSFMGTPDDIAYIVGATGYIISWSAVDTFASTYNITLDGELTQEGIWDSSGYITISVDNLSVGIYTFILYVYDTSGNVSEDTVTVTVT